MAKGVKIFWLSVSIVAAALVLFKLGSLSVWVALVSTYRKVAGGLGLMLIGFVAWRMVVRV